MVEFELALYDEKVADAIELMCRKMTAIPCIFLLEGVGGLVVKEVQ